jgi:hypothetical protein
MNIDVMRVCAAIRETSVGADSVDSLVLLENRILRMAIMAETETEAWKEYAARESARAHLAASWAGMQKTPALGTTPSVDLGRLEPS